MCTITGAELINQCNTSFKKLRLKVIYTVQNGIRKLFTTPLQTAFQVLLQNYTVLYFLFYFIVSLGVLRLSPLGTWATNWPTLPAPDDK
jgi:L-lactate permease